jgi:hypothetical protein
LVLCFSFIIFYRKYHSGSAPADAEHKFIENASDWGFSEMVVADDLFSQTGGFIHNGIMLVKVKCVLLLLLLLWPLLSMLCAARFELCLPAGFH